MFKLLKKFWNFLTGNSEYPEATLIKCENLKEVGVAITAKIMDLKKRRRNTIPFDYLCQGMKITGTVCSWNEGYFEVYMISSNFEDKHGFCLRQVFGFEFWESKYMPDIIEYKLKYLADYSLFPIIDDVEYNKYKNPKYDSRLDTPENCVFRSKFHNDEKKVFARKVPCDTPWENSDVCDTCERKPKK